MSASATVDQSTRSNEETTRCKGLQQRCTDRSHT